MEAGILLRSVTPANLLRHRFTARRRSTMTSLIPQGRYRGSKPKRECVVDWVSKNDDLVRSLPIYVGGISILAVLVWGIAPVADASRFGGTWLGRTSILNGLVWLSIRPKYIYVVNPDGVECRRMLNHLPDSVVSELLCLGFGGT